MNILIMSISKKVPLIQSVRKALDKINDSSKIFGADSNNEIIGRFFVDEFWKVPKLPQFTIEMVLTFCEINNIKAIIPTRDGELKFFAKHKCLLEKRGIATLISSLNTIELCIDKMSFYEMGVKYGFPTIDTSYNVNRITSDSVVLKERVGSGSTNIQIGISKEQAQKYVNHFEKPIYQPFIKGAEYSIDVYITRQQQAMGAIVRKRVLVINGESQITTTSLYEKLEKLVIDFALKLGLYGHAVFQVIETEDNKLYIIECNPRFGGASTLSIAAGLDSFYWFFLEVLGQELKNHPFHRGENELKLIRYSQDLIIESER